jgi:hypothetical protein
MNAKDLEEIDALVNMIHSQRGFIPNDDKEEVVDNNTEEHHYDTDKFRELVKCLLKVEDDLDSVSKHAKDLRTRKKEYRDSIVVYMQEHHLDSLNLPDGSTFNLKVSKNKINPLTKSRIPDNITRYFIEKESMKSERALEKTAEILTFIESKADYKEIKSLRRQKR